MHLPCMMLEPAVQQFKTEMLLAAVPRQHVRSGTDRLHGGGCKGTDWHEEAHWVVQPCLKAVLGLQGINYTPTFRLYHKGRRVSTCLLAPLQLPASSCCRMLLKAWHSTRLCELVCRLMSSCHRTGSRFETTSGCILR